MDSAARRTSQLREQLTPQPSSATTDALLHHLHSSDSEADRPRLMLAAERAKATFDARELTVYLDGGETMTQIKERIMLELERDPTFKIDDYHDLSREQIRERTMIKARNIIHYFLNEPEDVSRTRMDLISLADPGCMTRLGVHFGLFFGAVRGQASAPQLTHWIDKGMLTLKNFFGCFCMTELGHGSNVAGLETTATFDPVMDEFIIHTPTLTATKWWIGGAAHTATHGVVFAQMIIHGKKHGVKSFIVPLRNTNDFSLKPGVNIGDCGAKMGRHGIDNGWIQFTHVRIPRTNMLMRHTKVSKEGVVREPPLAQVTYGALIGGRVSMVMDAANVAKKALTIAIRYSAVRRQFATRPGDVENPILNYPTHQIKLLPLLAAAFAMHFGAVEMNRLFDSLNSQLDKFGSGNDSKEESEAIIESLKETHATSSGLKAFCTWNTLNIIEQCRQSCGGHGYSAYTGLASMGQDFAVQCTWEGDNTVLTLQSGRYLLTCYRERLAGKTVPPGVGYINHLSELISPKPSSAKTIEQLCDFAVIGRAHDIVSANMVRELAIAYDSGVKEGLDPEVVLESIGAHRFNTGRAHCFGYLFHRFADGVAHAPESLQDILKKLCTLYGLSSIVENSGLHLQYGFLVPEQMKLIREHVLLLCGQIRHQAVALCDSFNFSDFIINSPLGRKDGDVYRHYFDTVRRAPNSQGRAPYFESVIKPLVQREDQESSSPEENSD